MKCQGLIGSIFGHKFKPIFNIEKGVPTIDPYNGKALLFGEDIEALKLSCSMKETYVISICSRCGISLINKEN